MISRWVMRLTITSTLFLQACTGTSAVVPPDGGEFLRATDPGEEVPVADAGLCDGKPCKSVEPCSEAECPSTCVDECRWQEQREGQRCDLFDVSTRQRAAFTQGLADRARDYEKWLRQWMMCAGLVNRAWFKDEALTQFDRFEDDGGPGESALWSGLYLATQAVRYKTTGSLDALAEVKRVAALMHMLWNVSGSPGYLARFAAPVNSGPRIDSLFVPNSDDRVPYHHLNRPYLNQQWNWMGHVSRDMYMGPLVGLSMAYDLLEENEREWVRQDVVEFVLELMKDRTIIAKVDGIKIPLNVRYMVATFDEPQMLEVHTSDFSKNRIVGLQEFMPKFFGRIVRPSSTMIVGAAFTLALRVTENQPRYASQRAAIKHFFDEKISEWMDIAGKYKVDVGCGDEYFSVHITHSALYTWLWNEQDSVRKTRLQEIMRNNLWESVKTHKNVLFAYMFAGTAAPSPARDAAITMANAQLALFPNAPSTHRPISNPGTPTLECPNNATVAYDVPFRVSEDFLWQRQPFKMNDTVSTPLRTYPGLDYLWVYWLGRYYGFLQDERPNVCSKWLN